MASITTARESGPVVKSRFEPTRSSRMEGHRAASGGWSSLVSWFKGRQWKNVQEACTKNAHRDCGASWCTMERET